MPQIDFYVLSKSDLQERLIFTCRLVEKVVKLGHKVIILTSDKQDSQSLDDLLWTFRPESFVPHKVLTENDMEQSSVGITHETFCTLKSGDVLVNLSQNAPTNIDQFQRLVEIVVQDQSVLTSTRNHFAYYRDKGYAIETHNIK